MEFEKYLRMQGELGGFEVVLNEPISRRVAANKEQPRQVAKAIIKPQQNQSNDSLWQNATNACDFYNALRQHSIYTKRGLEFCAPKEAKINAPFFLIFHSPQELTTEAKSILDRLFKKLCVDLNACAVSFFFKCSGTALPRERPVLKEMLCKEVEFINPEKIIFFREANSSAIIDGTPITFAGKQAITLYSLLEMLQSSEKIKSTWSVLPNCGWFSQKSVL
ncbi:MAG: hypothetical protein FWC26_07530 [Fibromonadales bacterium]|nr:hypothetical protein [Fibromonadales bacterium]